MPQPVRKLEPGRREVQCRFAGEHRLVGLLVPTESDRYGVDQEHEPLSDNPRCSQDVARGGSCVVGAGGTCVRRGQQTSRFGFGRRCAPHNYVNEVAVAHQ